MSNWLVMGAAGGIATHLVRELASRGHRLFLADVESANELLERNAEDVRVRYDSEVYTSTFDVLENKEIKIFLDGVEDKLGPIDGIVWTIGVMWSQIELEKNLDKASLHHEINYLSAMRFLSVIANRMEKQRRGMIVAISSPAGDRGRQSNYFYGADKAALTVFMQGLRQRLARKKVHVLTVKPGPVQTAMTEGMENLPLLALPSKVASDIAKAINKKKNVIYTPWPWTFIMMIIRHIPDRIFKWLKM